MGRTRRFIHGMAFGYLNQVMVLVVGLAVTPFILHRVGLKQYGMWLIGTQLLNYLALLDFGVVSLLPRQTAYVTGRVGHHEARDEGVPVLVGKVATIVLWQTPLVAGASVIIWMMMPASWGEFDGALGLVLLAYTLLFPMRIFQAVLQGLQDLAFLGALQTSAWALGTLTTVGLLYRSGTLESLAAGWVITQVALTFGSALRIVRHYPAVAKARLVRLSESTLKSYLGRSAWVGVSQLSQAIMSSTDIAVLGSVLGPAAAVPYAMTDKLPNALANKPQLLMETAAPALSEIRTGATPDHVLRVTRALTDAMLVSSGLIVCLVLAVNHGFIRWWVGEQYFGGTWLNVVLVLCMLIRHWATANVYSIFCFGREREMTYIGFLEGIVGLAGSVVLGRWLGVIGVPLGALIGVGAVGLPFTWFVLSQELRVPMKKLLAPLLGWLARFIAIAGASAALPSFWIPSTVIGLTGASLLVIAGYGIVMWPVVQHGPLGEYVIPRLTALKARTRVKARPAREAAAGKRRHR